jgi:hypothetical protein
MDKRRVLLFKGQSQYDVLRFFTDELNSAFQKLGLPTVVIDLLSPNFNQQLLSVLQEGNLLFALGFNAVGQELQVEGKPLYDLMKVPYVAFYVDHPVYQIPRIQYSMRYKISSFVDKGHLDFVKKYISPKLFTVFIPHGGSVAATDKNSILPLSKRTVPLFFAGSYRDPDEYLQSLNISEDIALFIRSIAEIMLTNEKCNIQTALELYCNTIGVELTTDYFPLIQVADYYFRLVKRKQIILSLEEVGLIVCGNGWEQLKSRKTKLQIMPPKSYSDILHIMGNTKLFLSIVPTFTKGSHERVFSTMLSGAVSVADKSEYMEQAFVSGAHYLGYDSSVSLPDLVATALEQDAYLEKIAMAGQTLAETQHRWENRAVDILKAVNQFLQQI